jgi:hypothetical protein
MLRQRIFAIALGYEDLNDHSSLRVDPAIQLFSGAPEGALASSPTLCRLENRVDRRAVFKIQETIVDSFIAAHAGAPPRELTLDFDTTDVAIHGKQEGRFFHGYYDSYCFLPLYVFCGEHLLVALLKPSWMGAAKRSWAILALLVKKLRSVWPDVKITFRGDSAFSRWRMLKWCEKNNVGYIVGVARNARLEAMAGPLREMSRAAFEVEGKPHRCFGDVSYAAQTWDKPRRVIVKAEHLPSPREGDDSDKANTRFVVTNLAGDAQSLYEDLYCARGDMENRVKEQQLGLFADRTSCHDFQANQFRLTLSAAAYVLVQHIRRVGLAGTRLAVAQVTRIRLELFKIGGRVVKTVRRIVFHLASGSPAADVFRTAVERLMAPP